MGDKDESVSVEEMLRQAFRQYEEPDSMISAADQIVCAAMQGPRLYFTQVPSGNLTITVGNGEAFEVELPFGMFRMLLARFSGICAGAAEKHSLVGKARASLMRTGLLAGKDYTIRPTIEYVSAIDVEQPYSSPYKADVYLDVKQPNGTTATLHMQMHNCFTEYFLLIERRKDTFNKPNRAIPKGSNVNAPNELASVEEMLRHAFRQYKEEPDLLVSVADQILCAAMRAPKLYFEPTPSKRLAISIDDGEAFEVELQDQHVSRFRTLLARFGVICGAAAEKRSVIGKAKSSLMRAGILMDKHVIERRDQTIEYVSAIIREEPCSPAYKVDADLYVKQPNGTAATLHLQMNNRSGNYFLLIEPRKSTQ